MKHPTPAPSLFSDTCQDMPLFSGTPQTARQTPFTPDPAVRQPNLFNACPACFGTGKVATRPGQTPRPCICGAGKMS